MIASDGDSFTDLLLDLLVPTGNLGNAKATKHSEGSNISFTYVSEDTVEKYVVDGELLRTLRYEKTVDGETIVRIKYGDFESLGDVSIPRSLWFEDHKHGVSAKLYYKDAVLNEKENAEFSIPSDAKEVILN